MIQGVLFLFFFVFSTYALHVSIGRSIHNMKTSTAQHARRSLAEEYKPPEYSVGVDIPPEIAQQSCIYDMILVERLSTPEQTSGGLFLPKIEGKDQKRLGKVLSVPPSSYGLESEQGRVAGLDEIAPCKVGDIVLLRDPWGVGPKNEEIGPRCFSFHKAVHILAVVKSSS